MADERPAIAFWGVLLGLSVLGLWLLRSILPPFVLGMAIAFLLDPLMTRLARLGVPRGAAAGLIVAGSYVVGAVALVLLLPVVIQQLSEIAAQLPGVVAAASDVLRPVLAGPLRAVAERAGTLAGEQLGALVAQGWAVLGFVLVLAVTPVVTFYLLRDWPALIARVDASLPRAHANTIRAQAREIERVLAGFVRGQALVCGLLGLFYAAALSALGVRFGLVIGLIAGGASFVPYVGTALGLVASVGVAVVQFWPGAVRPLLALAIFFIGQVVADYVVGPRLVGERVGLHPVWVVFAILAGGTLFGTAGMLAAVPLSAVIGVLMRFGMERYRTSAYYRGPASE